VAAPGSSSSSARLTDGALALGRLCNSDPLQWWKAWATEVAPRTGAAGGVIGLILVTSTMPQVVSTSDGKMPKLTPSMWGRMVFRIWPVAGGLKAAQYTVLREMKFGLDGAGCHPGVSTMLSFGVIGTLFQSVIYNTLIAEMYKAMTGEVKKAPSVAALVQGVKPGILWCFGRECGAMGGGMYLGPMVKVRMSSALSDGNGGHSIFGLPVSEGVMRFSSGFTSGACTAFGTQGMHNISLIAGRMAAKAEPVGAPYYTAASATTAYKELGLSLFYINYPQRMCLIAGAVALLNMCDIFHRPELRMI